MNFKILEAYINLCEANKLNVSWRGLIDFKNVFFKGENFHVRSKVDKDKYKYV